MMANLEEMSRVLYSHDWARVQDWVTALDQLATLTDDEIAALVRQAARPPASSVLQWTLTATAGVPGSVATPGY
jgi:Tfp pilus assembly protein PilN